ncbi:MAG: hypothetical protein NVSMB51_06210 [Solirubrobacteraceae bacterium]
MSGASRFALARIAYAAGLGLAPAQFAGGWVGHRAAAAAGTQIGLRGLAGRDAALSAGILAARIRGRSARPWLLLCALGDGIDVAATLSAPPAQLPGNARAGTLALAGGSALLGLALALRG